MKNVRGLVVFCAVVVVLSFTLTLPPVLSAASLAFPWIDPEGTWTPIVFDGSAKELAAKVPESYKVILPSDVVKRNGAFQMAISPAEFDPEMHRCLVVTYTGAGDMVKSRLYCKWIPSQGVYIPGLKPWKMPQEE